MLNWRGGGGGGLGYLKDSTQFSMSTEVILDWQDKGEPFRNFKVHGTLSLPMPWPLWPMRMPTQSRHGVVFGWLFHCPRRSASVDSTHKFPAFMVSLNVLTPEVFQPIVIYVAIASGTKERRGRRGWTFAGLRHVASAGCPNAKTTAIFSNSNVVTGMAFC